MKLSWWNSDDVLTLTWLLYRYGTFSKRLIEHLSKHPTTIQEHSIKRNINPHLKANMSFLSKAEDQVEQSLDGSGQSGGQEQSQDQSQDQSGSGMEQKADSFVNNGECSFEPKKVSSLRSSQK
jgi:hypothetical protein